MLRYVLPALAIGLLSTAASAQVTNGGFEDPVVSGPCCSTVPPDSLTGWTATPNVNVVLGSFNNTPSPAVPGLAYEGNQYVDLVGQSGDAGYVGGSIEQLLTLISGNTYTLTFAYSHNLFSPDVTNSASARVTVGDLSADVFHRHWRHHQPGLANFHTEFRRRPD